ncbi:MAG: type IV pilus secretin PilQ [Firmicutes bacterium]|nr:type IV pilus secretin PilQ [Bacillota bacterium]
MAVENGTALDGKVLNLSLPGFSGKPRLQVLSSPDRVVLDLPGVLRGTAVSRQDIATLSGGPILKGRLAQFTTEPLPITRVVFEVAKGTQVAVTSQQGSLRLSFEKGQGPIQARMADPAPALIAPSKATPTVETERIAQIAPETKPVETKVAEVAPAQAVQVAQASKPELAPMPSVGMPFRALPALAASTLLPATPGVAAQTTPTPQPAAQPTTNRGVRALGETQARYTGAKMSIDAKNTDLQDFLRLIADVSKMNLIADQDVQGNFTLRFVDTPWDQVLDHILKHAGLGKEVSNGVIRVAKIEKLQKEEEDRKRLDDAKALAGDVQSVTIPLSFAKVSEIRPIIEKMLTKRGGLITDERTNTLIVTDLPRNLPVIDELVAQLDVQIQQVQIEARVVEATKGLEEAWGVKWPTSNSGDAKLQVGSTDAAWGTYGAAPSWNSAGGFNRPASGQAVGMSWAPGKSDATGIAGAAGELWASFLSNRMSVNVILQALQKEGRVKIVSEPKLVTQNNKKSHILSGEKIPYPSQQGGAAGGAISVAFVEANLQLDVTPQITNDGTIIMDLKVEKSEADFSRTVMGSPTIQRRAVETQVLVKDGGTAVLGGVYVTKTNNGTTGVPFLSKIPVLGWLFKSKTDKEDTAELLIFITPRILKS